MCVLCCADDILKVGELLCCGHPQAKYEFPWMSKQFEGFVFDPMAHIPSDGNTAGAQRAFFVADTPAEVYSVILPLPNDDSVVIA
jgi:hypothetical protein